MADERTLYAGDLTSDQIGKIIRVQVNKTTMVEDRLSSVKHARTLAGGTETIVWFSGTPNQAAKLVGDGFHIAHTAHVTVVQP